jgi:hypothetical protein
MINKDLNDSDILSNRTKLRPIKGAPRNRPDLKYPDGIQTMENLSNLDISLGDVYQSIKES